MSEEGIYRDIRFPNKNFPAISEDGKYVAYIQTSYSTKQPIFYGVVERADRSLIDKLLKKGIKKIPLVKGSLCEEVSQIEVTFRKESVEFNFIKIHKNPVKIPLP